MPRLKWFLTGIVFTLFLMDWARLHIERVQLFHETQIAIDISEQRGNQVGRCLAALEKSKDLMDTAQVAYLARVQTFDEMAKSKDGKQNKKDFLASVKGEKLATKASREE